MTEVSQVWDGILIGDAAVVAPYSAAEWAARQKLLQGQGSIFPNYGVLVGTGDGTYSPLSVQPKSPASTNIEVEIGAALVAGYLYQNTAALSFTIASNASGNPRIDTVVLRADFVAQTIRAVVKQGTPAGSPVRPTLQQDAVIWEMPLADIAVANGFSVINQVNITNRQRAIQSLSAGWQPIANPIVYAGGANYTGAFITFSSNSAAKAIPIIVTGNMLLQDVLLQHNTTVITYTMDWGLYIQDTNDGNTSENTLRLVAQGGASGSTSGTQNISLPATPAPQVIKPGMYWLVIRNTQFAPTAVQIGALTPSAFDDISYRLGTISGLLPLPQTLDFVTGWTTSNTPVAVKLRGRVFGMTTVL